MSDEGEQVALEDLKVYLGVEHNLMDIVPREKLEGILERTVKAFDAGATPEQIKEIFGEYISAWRPDTTYG